MTTLKQAEERARSIVNKFAVGATAAAFVPGSSLALAGADIVMINEISEAFGCGTAGGEGFITSVGAGVAGKSAANFLMEFVPLAKNVVAGAGTKALGEAAIQYFKKRSRFR